MVVVVGSVDDDGIWKKNYFVKRFACRHEKLQELQDCRSCSFCYDSSSHKPTCCDSLLGKLSFYSTNSSSSRCSNSSSASNTYISSSCSSNWKLLYLFLQLAKSNEKFNSSRFIRLHILIIVTSFFFILTQRKFHFWCLEWAQENWIFVWNFFFLSIFGAV